MTQVINRSGFVADDWAATPIASPDSYEGGAAIALPADTDPGTAAALTHSAKLVVITFDAHTDGRGFSLAAILRDRGYRGHLRARGPLLVDQFRAALRSGFDDVQISADQARRNPEQQWQAVALSAGYLSRVFA